MDPQVGPPEPCKRGVAIPEKINVATLTTLPIATKYRIT